MLGTKTQERKANAITHLEPVLVGMCQRTLLTGIIKSLAAVKKPMFEPMFNEYLEYQGEDDENLML